MKENVEGQRSFWELARQKQFYSEASVPRLTP